MTKTRLLLILVPGLGTYMTGLAMPLAAGAIAASVAAGGAVAVLIKRWGSRSMRAAVVIASAGLVMGAAVTRSDAVNERNRAAAYTKRVAQELERQSAAEVRALSAVREKASEFAYAAEGSGPDGLNRYTELQNLIATAQELKVTSGALWKYVEPLRPLTEAVEEIELFDSKAPELPTAPDKPTYVQPPRRGFGQVFKLSGTYRGSFDGGGIVVSQGDSYYVVRDAERPTFSRVNGFVQVVDFARLNIGGGRDAKVVLLSDREAYRESEREYREEVRDAKTEHKEAMRTYTQAKSSLARRKREYEKTLDARSAERAALVTKRNEAMAKSRVLLRKLANVGEATNNTGEPLR